MKAAIVQNIDDHDSLVLRLRKDLAAAAVTLTPREARYLVDLYYQVQEYRIALAGQIRAVGTEEPHAMLDFMIDQVETLEGQLKRALDLWTRDHPLSAWARGICGIGPVIAAGLRAHIDITKAPTVGHIWRFAGLDPTLVWERGQKRPFNASLRVLCYKIGESFVKVQNNDSDVYGVVYATRKVLEIERNEAGQFKEQAAQVLAAKKIGKATEAYKAYSVGKLPPAHIHARARRYAVKLFLAHYWETAYRLHFGTEPPLPYPIAHLGHVHKIEPSTGREPSTGERANEGDRSTRHERAQLRESANVRERAGIAESTMPVERAKDRESAK